MKFHSSIPERIFKLLFFGILSWFLLALSVTIVHGIAMGIMEWPYLLAVLPFILILLSAKYQSAPGELTAEGVYVRHFFIRRFYPWSEILQAGILAQRGRNDHCEIILVKPGGSPRRPGDHPTLFLMRNLFRLIHIPADEETAAYVVARFGPLAYDQSKGVWDL